MLKGSELKSARIWYIRCLRDSHTLSLPVPFDPEAGTSTASMYTSERARYSKGYRAAELCCNLGGELGTDRGEDRVRFSAELSPSNQRLSWTPYGQKQPCGHCQLLWSCAASSRCICSSSSPLAAARRVRSAGSTLVRELKEHRTFDCEEAFASGLHSQPRATRAGLTVKERTDGIA